MELYQLRSFAAVAELGNLTRAAEKLHVSQPAVSTQIKALEDDLAAALFVPTATGMVLTAAGRRLLPEATKVIAAVQELRAKARLLEGQVAGKALVGTLSDPDVIRIGEFLGRAVEHHPLLEIELHQEISGTAFEKLRDGVLDASFYYGELAHPQVASVPLREIAYRVVAPAAWSERIDRAGWDTIAAEPWIMPPPISSLHVLATQFFRAHGVAPAKLIEADNEAVIRSLVIAGLGVALMREDLARESADAGEICYWSGARLPTVLQFIHLRERESEPAIHALLDVIRDVWGEPWQAAAPA
ncbi:MAG: LysR family transcriptional regulator [Aromatoleum sp.]|nr:LysR family transcriptional regulator [Aromatoleum sp.]